MSRVAGPIQLHAPQQRKGKDDAPVLGLFEVTTQQIGDGPEESSRLGMIFRVHATTPNMDQQSATVTLMRCEISLRR